MERNSILLIYLPIIIKNKMKTILIDLWKTNMEWKINVDTNTKLHIFYLDLIGCQGAPLSNMWNIKIFCADQINKVWFVHSKKLNKALLNLKVIFLENCNV